MDVKRSNAPVKVEIAVFTHADVPVLVVADIAEVAHTDRIDAALLALGDDVLRERMYEIASAFGLFSVESTRFLRIWSFDSV